MPSTADYVRAEFIRSRGSALQWLPLIGLPLALMTVAFSQAAATGETAHAALGWQAMFVTGMAAPLTALFGAAPELREKAARGGGIDWRPCSPARLRLARLAGVWTALGLFFLINFGITWLICLVMGLSECGVILVAGLYAFAGSLGVAALSAALARRYGSFAAVGSMIAFQLAPLAGITESSAWWAFPPAWPLRLILPVLRIHPNAVPLDPGSPLLNESPLPALCLCLLLAAFGAWAAAALPNRRRSPWAGFRASVFTNRTLPVTAAKSLAVVPRRSTQPASLPMQAMGRAALSPAVRFCLAASVIVLALVALVYPVSYSHGLYVFAILPVGTGVLPVLVWPLLRDAWPVMLTENGRCVPTLIVWLIGTVASMSLAAALVGLSDGGQFGDELRRFALAVLVGSTLALCALTLMLRFGQAAALSATVIWTIVSVTLGGDVLADSPLWIAALPSWPEIATSPGRIAIAFVLGGLSASLFGWLTLRALRSPRILVGGPH